MSCNCRVCTPTKARQKRMYTLYFFPTTFRALPQMARERGVSESEILSQELDEHFRRMGINPNCPVLAKRKAELEKIAAEL